MFRIYIIAGLAMAVLAIGWALKTSLEKNAVLESKYEAQQAETQKAINQINALKIDHATQIAKSTEYFKQAREKNKQARNTFSPCGETQRKQKVFLYERNEISQRPK